MSAGKGDTYRPVKVQTYIKNFDQIKWQRPVVPVKKQK
jgi:hypothetical protein